MRSTPHAANYDFWHLGWSSRHRVNTRQSWDLEWLSPRDAQYAFLKPDPIPFSVPAGGFVVQAARDHGFDDFAFIPSDIGIVSHRTKLVIEQDCMDNCNFFPLRILYRHTELQLAEPYWIAQVRNEIECADSSDSHRLGQWYVNYAISADRVPERLGMFNVRNALQRTLIRDRLRKAFKREGLIGYELSPIRHTSGK